MLKANFGLATIKARAFTYGESLVYFLTTSTGLLSIMVNTINGK